MMRKSMYRRMHCLLYVQTDLESVTEVQLTDQSKLGTTLDTQKFKDKTVKLTKHEHLVQLGNYHQKFR